VSESPGKAGPFCSWAPNAGAGSGRRRVQTLRCVFREPPVAGRHADELGELQKSIKRLKLLKA